jgi:Mn2+/Fe2+ NRAMP family transporter
MPSGQPFSGFRSGMAFDQQQLVTFLAIVGPGPIVMLSDNDAGGVATHAQAVQMWR